MTKQAKIIELNEYLSGINAMLKMEEQQDWFIKLEDKAQKGMELFNASDENEQKRVLDEFYRRVRTEELKAWYSEPQGNSVFQGTSISSLTIPYEVKSPLNLRSVADLEERVANAYIKLHGKYSAMVKNAIIEDIDEWLNEGLYYGVVLSSKIISQAFDLAVKYDDVVMKIGKHVIDPHEITTFPDDVRREYFEKCLKYIRIFEGTDLEQRELESSLVLADISKPNIRKYKNKILLAPVRCNEIAALLSEGIIRRIKEKSSGKINPRGLTVVIYDTDTPYTYHRIMGYYGRKPSPVLPGLIVLGASGTIDAFRWLYAYRTSLIAQKIMKGSLYSEVHKNFVPFVFFGVLVPRDAEILLDMDNLHMLRYKGNIAPDLEFFYIVSELIKFVGGNAPRFSWDSFRKKHHVK
ncbi:MAG: hypothetical protein EPN22_13515 [Nitrospirae bacterium]|nr:MAG: hypothetical protein EPN22_13515 [Nitrospirota bacterium]